jgi:hypothetical protein
MSGGQLVMAMHFSPDIVTNGLVFNYDDNSVRSYTGPPIQNLAQIINPNGVTDTNIQYTTGYEEVTVPTLGKIPAVAFVDGYNSNSASYCCMQQFYFTNGNNWIACSSSTTYTYSIVYKVTSDYTHPNFMYRYEYTAGGAYVGEAGIHDTAKRVHLGNGWYWAWNTFTTGATTTQIALRSFYYQYNVSDRFSMARVLVTPGDYTGLHPRLWPALGTTKSATQSFKDGLGSSTSSAADVTYASSGAVSFNGSSNYIRWNNNTALDTQMPSVEVWVKTNATSQNGFWFEKGTVNAQYALFQEGGVIQWRMNIGGTSTNLSTTTASFMNTSNWFHVVATYTSGSRILYINGVAVNSDAQTGTIATNSGGMTIGEYGGAGYRYNGLIGAVRVYNRALTAAEVLLNFNAHRGRYGV